MDLSEYAPRREGSDGRYRLIEEAIGFLVRGHAREAQQTIERAIEEFVAVGDAQGEYRARAKAAIVYRQTNELDRAEEQSRLAITYYDTHPEPSFHATAALELGQVLYARGDLSGALTVYGNALAALGEPSSGEPKTLPQLRAFLEDCAANVHSVREEFEEAVRLRRRALPTFEAQGLRIDSVIGWANLALDHLNMDDLDGARLSVRRANDLVEKLNHVESQAQVALVAGLCHAQQLRFERPSQPDQYLEMARGQLWRAISRFDQIDRPLQAVEARLALADLEIEFGDAAEGAHLIRAAARRLPLLEQCTSPFERALRSRLDTLRMKHATREFQVSGMGDVIPKELLNAPGVQISSSESPWVPAFHRARAFSAAAPEDMYPFYWAASDSERALVEVERLKSIDLIRLLQRQRGQRDESAFAEAKAAIDIGGQQLAIRPAHTSALREAFVDYYCCDGRILAFLERAGEPVRVFPIAVSAEQVAKTVADLRTAFDGGGARLGIVRNQPFRVKTDALDEMGRALLPFRHELAAATMVCIFPSGPLCHFPFHAVRDKGTPLIATHAVAYGLSRRVLAAARTKHGVPATGTPRPRSALVVSVPAATERHPELFFGDGDFLADLGVAAHGLETPGESIVVQVLKEMQVPDLLQFNCHGVFSTADPLDSALIMSDGVQWPSRVTGPTTVEDPTRLTARRIFPLQLRASTVVLRACSSGVTRVRAGDEQEGLLRAFVNTGVASSIVTRWKVDVESSRELIHRMYTYWLRERLPKVVALQKAQLDLLTHAGCPYYQHPYHWAPFVLIGDWW